MASRYLMRPLVRTLSIASFCTAFSEEYGPDFDFKGESHDFYEAVFIFSGEAEVTAGSEVLRLSADQMILHPPLEFHRIRNVGTGSLRILVLTFGLESDRLTAHLVRSFTVEEGNEMKDFVDFIQKATGSDTIFVGDLAAVDDPLALNVAVNRLEILLLTLLARKTPSAPLVGNEKKAREYTAVVSFLQENLSARLTVDEIAHRFHVSRSSLQKMFLHYAGVGVITYYHRLQAARASELLRQGHTVKETASALGFTDQNYFSRFFSKLTGAAPTKCKKNL